MTTAQLEQARIVTAFALDSDWFYFLAERGSGSEDIVLWARTRRNIPQDNRHHSEDDIPTTSDDIMLFGTRKLRLEHHYDVQGRYQKFDTNKESWFHGLDIDDVLDAIELDKEPALHLIPAALHELLINQVEIRRTAQNELRDRGSQTAPVPRLRPSPAETIEETTMSIDDNEDDAWDLDPTQPGWWRTLASGDLQDAVLAHPQLRKAFSTR